VDEFIGKSKWARRKFWSLSYVFWLGRRFDYERKFRFGGVPPSIPVVKSESGVVQSSLKRQTWLLSPQDSVPPSKVQRGRVVIPGDFSVPAVRVVEVTG